MMTITEWGDLEEFPPLPSGSSTPSSLSEPIKSVLHAQKPMATSRTIILPVEEQRRPALGETLVPGEIARSVMRMTGCEIEMSISALTKTITMVVRGQKVDEACRMVRSKLGVLQRDSVQVYKGQLGVLIGQKGKTIKGITKETGARVIVPDLAEGGVDGEDAEVEVIVEGTGSACAEAIHMINALLQERSLIVTKQIEVHSTYESFVIGSQLNRSETLKGLGEEFGCRVTTVNGKIILSGESDKVEIAERTLCERLDRVRKEVKMISTIVPKFIHKYLVGTKGSVLKGLEQSTKCHFSIPSSADPSDTITVWGRPADVVGGLAKLLEFTSGFCEESVQCPMPIRLFLGTKHKAELRDIANSVLQFRSEEDGFVVIGDQMSALNAAERLSKLIHSLELMQFDTVGLKPNMAKHVIGKQGQGIERLERDHGIAVIMANDSLILLVGDSLDKISKARLQITEMLSNIENEQVTELPVDRKYFTKVLKQFRPFFQSTECSVFLNQKKGVLRIRGLKGAEYDLLVKDIEAKLDRIKHSAILHSYTLELAVPEAAKQHLSVKGIRSKFFVPSDLNIELDKGKLVLSGLKAAVDPLSSQLLGHLQDLSDFLKIQVSVPAELLGKTIGKMGRNLQQLIKRHSVDVSVNQASAPFIEISGCCERVLLCEQELEDFIEYLRGHSNVNLLTVQPSVISRLLARKGELVNELQSSLDLHISINSQDRSVRLEGSLGGIEECCMRLEGIALDGHEEVIPIPSELELKLQELNAYFRSYQQANTPHIQVHHQNSNLLLCGPKDLVLEGRALIEQFLLKLQQKLFTEQSLTLNQNQRGLIIGTRGSTIKRLCASYNVSIVINSQADQVSVSGEKVAEAVEEILRISQHVI